MNILWISARIFDVNEETESGVWLKALAVKLAESGKIILGNISIKRGIKKPERCDFGRINQWALPIPKINRKGYPDRKTKLLFEEVVREFNPVIIQIWGSENPFKLLPFDEKYPGIKVLTMQGVLSSIAPVLFAGMDCRELISTIGLQELLLRKNLFTIKKSFKKEGILEIEMIRKSNIIITQSEWTESQIISVNDVAKFYRVNRVLRAPFNNCKKWYEFEHNKHTIYTASFGYTLKGLHVLIKAMPIVKKKFPEIKLNIAGVYGRKDFLGNGYFRFLLRLVKKFGLEENINWLGPLTANEIVNRLQEASVFVNTSFVESYSMVLSEAMSVGTPSVISFAGAMPELAENNKEALFFTPGDYKRCAYLIIKLLSDKELSTKLSVNAVKRAEERNVKQDIVKQQLEIYDEIISIGQKENHKQYF